MIEELTFAVLDAETTGFEPETDAVCEIAAVAMSVKRGLLGMWATLVNPGIPIPPQVSAVHGIVDSDVTNKPNPANAQYALSKFYERIGASAVVAHNAAFDSGFISCRDIPPAQWICTMRLARHLWPDAPNYKNMTLRYWRNLAVDTFGIAPHRALGDALVTAALLRDILRSSEFAERGISSLEELQTLCNSPIRYTTWPYGKYRDQPLTTDVRYARWALTGMKDLDPDLRFSLLEIV